MDIVLRAAAIFVFVFLITRMIGRRELGLGEPFDVILLVVLGDLIQQGVTQNDYSVTGTMLALGTFTLLTVALSYFSFRSRRLRTVLEGHPLVLIEDGKPVEHNLKSQRLALDEVLAEARVQQVASMDEIRWAILETSGAISVIPK
ncbi:MAG TPA: YetF domain-containing protein [Gaiellales bacterium]|nr:YetF domain-containing protein [Gaiellales bacterium]